MSTKTSNGFVDKNGDTVKIKPATHTHAMSDVTGLQTALNGKAPSSHTHTKSEITDFPTAIGTEELTARLLVLEKEVFNLYKGGDITQSHTATQMVSSPTRILQNVAAGTFSATAVQEGFPTGHATLEASCLIIMKTGTTAPTVSDGNKLAENTSNILAIEDWGSTFTISEAADIYVAYIVSGYAEYLETSYCSGSEVEYSTSGTISVSDIDIRKTTASQS